jgi:hypothetical protein
MVTINLSLPNPNPSGLNLVASCALFGEPYLRTTFNSVQAPLDPNSVFLIMSFQGEGMGEVLAVVKHECDTLGLKATRVDDAVGSGFVIKQIGELIERAEIIVCDLTYERPNVYYELGYAHGVGNGGDNVLLIAREGTTLHFDIGPLRVNLYSSLKSLRAILQRNLPEMHRLARLKLVPAPPVCAASLASPSSRATPSKSCTTNTLNVSASAASTARRKAKSTASKPSKQPQT